MKIRHVATALFAAVASPAATAAEADAVPRSSGVITVRGEPHTYLSEGRGEPCIVTGFAPQYAPVFSANLKRHIRFIYVHFRKSWGAPAQVDPKSVTMDTLVEEVDDVRKAFGIDRACIIGHSSTGLLAVEYAARHPDATSRLILIGVHPFWNKELFDTWRSFWAADASPERNAQLDANRRTSPDSLLATMDPSDAFAVRYQRNTPQLFVDYRYDFSWAWIGHQFSAPVIQHFWDRIVADYAPWERASGNRVPTFVALGRYDYAVPYRLWDRYRGVPNLSFAMFDRSAHFPMLEEPAKFDAAVLRWRQQTSVAR